MVAPLPVSQKVTRLLSTPTQWINLHTSLRHSQLSSYYFISGNLPATSSVALFKLSKRRGLIELAIPQLEGRAPRGWNSLPDLTASLIQSEVILSVAGAYYQGKEFVLEGTRTF